MKRVATAMIDLGRVRKGEDENREMKIGFGLCVRVATLVSFELFGRVWTLSMPCPITNKIIFIQLGLALCSTR